jgi:tetratricopeptide (TPR) repeat protein
MPANRTRSRPGSRDDWKLLDRDETLQRLEAAYQQAATGQLGIVTIAGEAGLGKTRLLLEFEDRLRATTPRPLVAYGRALAANSVGNGFQPLREAVADLLSDTTTTNAQRLRRFLKSMRTVAPEWLAALPAVGKVARAAVLTFEELAGQSGAVSTSMNAQFGQLVRQFTEEGTLVLLLDDLHWADDSTVDVLFYLSQQLLELPLLLVLAYRQSDLHDRGRIHPLRQALLRIERYCEVDNLTLSALTRRSVVYLAHTRLGVDPSPRLVEWLLERSEGNPLFIHEFLAHLQDRLRVSGRPISARQLDELVSSMEDIPRRLSVIIDERLESLEADELRTLQLAAIIGPAFTVSDVVGLSDLGEETTRRALRSLSQQSGLIRAGTQGDYTFFHGLIRDHTVRRLYAQDRVDYAELHGRRGAMLERAGIDTLERLEAAAHHFHEAAAHEEALTYATRAGETVRELGAISEARTYFSWSIQHADALDSVSEGVAARRRLANIEQELIRTDQAVQTLEGAKVLTRRDPHDESDLQLTLELARAYRMEERWAEAHAALNEARRQAAQGPSSDEQAASIALMAGELLLSGKPRNVSQAQGYFQEAATRTDEPFLLASAFGHLGFVALAQHDVPNAKAWFQRAWEQAHASQRPGRIYEAHLWRAKFALATLQLDDADAELQEMTRLSDHYGVASTVAHHLRDAGRRAALLGDIGQALPAYAAYLERMLAVANGPWRIRAQMYLYLQARELTEERGAAAAATMAAALGPYLLESFADSAHIDALVRQLRVVERALTNNRSVLKELESADLLGFWGTAEAEAARWVFTFHIDDLHAFRRKHGFRLPAVDRAQR